jgi:hypothetical protein
MDNVKQILSAARNELIERGVIAPDTLYDGCKIDFCDNVAEITMHGWLVFLIRLYGKYEPFYAVEQERMVREVLTKV